MSNPSAYKNNDATMSEPTELDFSQVKKRVAYWISKKDYSERELKEKLERWANPETIESIINWCHKLKLIPPAQAMTEQVVQSLNRQKKGIEQINHVLEKKGLAQIAGDQDFELDKAMALVNKKMAQSLRAVPWAGLSNDIKQKTKAKVLRFLATRGFSSEIILSSFEQWLKNNKETDVYENE